MKPFPFLRILFPLATAGFLGGTAFAHGGQWFRWGGPGDTVPDGTPSSPSTPSGPSGPTTPSGPSSPSTPSAPSGPAGPATPSGPSGGSPTGPSGGGPATPRGIDLTPSLETWDMWWGFNREGFLNLKDKLYAVDVVTDSAEFYLGLRNDQAADTIGLSRAQKENEIYPALVEVLEGNSGSVGRRMRDEISSALVALAKLGVDPENTIRILKSFLKSSDQEVQETAAVSLGILAEPQAIRILADLLEDQPSGRELVDRHEVPLRTRAFAAHGLGLVGYQLREEDREQTEHRRTIARLLIERLEKDDSAVKDVKIACISAAGLVAYSRFDLSSTVDPLVLRAFDRLLEDKQTKNIDLIRAHVPTAVMRIVRRIESISSGEDLEAYRDRYISRFLRMLGDKKEDASVRQSLVLALGPMLREGHPRYREVFSALVRIQDDARSEQESFFTAMALGQMGGEDADKFLLDQVRRGKRLYQPWAALGLGVRGFGKSDGDVPADTAHAIQMAMMQIKAPEYKGAFALALGLLRHRGASSYLTQELRESNIESYKGYVGVGLGLMGARESREVIREEIKKSKRKPDQLQQLAIALGLLGDKDVVDILLAIMREKRQTTSVYAAVARALGFVGDARSVTPLVEMIRDPDLTGEARAFAIVALGIVGDKERLPWNHKISENINYRANVTTLSGGSVGVLDIL